MRNKHEQGWVYILTNPTLSINLFCIPLANGIESIEDFGSDNTVNRTMVLIGFQP